MLRGKLSLRSAVVTRSTDNILAVACGCIGGTAAAAHTTATAVILDAGLCGIYKNRSAGNIDTAISVRAGSLCLNDTARQGRCCGSVSGFRVDIVIAGQDVLAL